MEIKHTFNTNSAWFQSIRVATEVEKIKLACHVYLSAKSHDDVIKCKHFPRYWPFVRGIHRSPVNSPHKGQWRGALMFYLICAWINGWVNNRAAGDLRRQRSYYDVTVMHGRNDFAEINRKRRHICSDGFRIIERSVPTLNWPPVTSYDVIYDIIWRYKTNVE